MASNQLKISQKFDLDSFQGIDQHRELVIQQKAVILTDFIQNRHLNLHMEAVCPPQPSIVRRFLPSNVLILGGVILDPNPPNLKLDIICARSLFLYQTSAQQQIENIHKLRQILGLVGTKVEQKRSFQSVIGQNRLVKNDKRKKFYVIYGCSRSTKVSQTVSASSWNLSTVYRLDSETLAFGFGTFDSFLSVLVWAEIEFTVYVALPKRPNRFQSIL